MIKSTELRIGNLVFVEKYGVVEVMSIDQHSTDGGILYIWREGMEFKHRISVDKATPIPLTPEILDKCWFSHHSMSVNFGDSGYDPKEFWYIMDGLDEFRQRKFLYGVIIGQFKDGFYYQAGQRRYKGIKITSLHQLQNLWHSLTGEELPVNLISSMSKS